MPDLVSTRKALEQDLWQACLVGDQKELDALRGIYADLLDELGEPAHVVGLARRQWELRDNTGFTGFVSLALPGVPFSSCRLRNNGRLRPFLWLGKHGLWISDCAVTDCLGLSCSRTEAPSPSGNDFLAWWEANWHDYR